MNEERRKKEIIDTSLINYLQLKFLPDTDNYIYWNKDIAYPDEQQITITTEDYIQQRNDIIDALPFSLELCSDHEVKQLFSLLTNHKWEEKHLNIRAYRNQAVSYLPQLLEALKRAQPILLPDGTYSEKIVRIPTTSGEYVILEFQYRTSTIELRNQHKSIALKIFTSSQDLHHSLQTSIHSMKEVIAKLQ